MPIADRLMAEVIRFLGRRLMHPKNLSQLPLQTIHLISCEILLLVIECYLAFRVTVKISADSSQSGNFTQFRQSVQIL
jgi:hypothetical protein